ncbi:GntR family transcriptional regulator [Desulfosporosinus sp. PR]|uniref:GntR family transcriptional regulator n=1 Tax=Candidatus Desulfosporosinus nitrosoreducens TaxID=3401928 RepID=UPI0027F629D1|nr:GntR family transcriptional regulator [Desulfosporosinus sp. PR]MDQ7095350.1 GntR family transcriptional regulator [Desulfosporosinus sp. PR]
MKEFNNSISIYVQIMDEVKRWIISGKLKGGDKLPAVRELALDFKVNPNTVQRMYQELEGEGIVYSQRGIGRFVTEDQGMIQGLKLSISRSLIKTFVEEMQALGFQATEIAAEIMNYLQEDQN